MADKDFYDIKGLGELPSEQAAPPPTPYRPSRSAAKTKHTIRNVVIILLILVVLAALSGGTYWYLKNHKSSKTKVPAASATVAPVAPSATATTSSTTTHYISNGQDLNLEFDYPSGWTVVPPTNNNVKDGTITVDSPSVSIPDASGSSTTGKATITIRTGTANLAELGSGTPTAAQDSLQIAYAQPTANQHQYTYITFIHFSTGANVPGAYEEALVTGIQSFKKGDPVTTTALAGIDPIIAVNFYRCGTSVCTGKGSGNLSITNTTWQSNSVVQQVQTLFKSLKLK